jgi:hypothetical protein
MTKGQAAYSNTSQSGAATVTLKPQTPTPTLNPDVTSQHKYLHQLRWQLHSIVPQQQQRLPQP